MLKYLIPRIAVADLPAMFGIAGMGGVIGGLYGAVHDQITYAIAPEYFTKLKFEQFAYANLGLGERVFASTIGFIATWWVGVFAAWFLARRLIPQQPRQRAYRQIRDGFLCVIAFGLTFGVMGYGYGLWRGPGADYSYWERAFQELEITDTWSFIRVAYIHNAGYLGGLVGLLFALLVIRPNRCQSTESQVPSV